VKAGERTFSALIADDEPTARRGVCQLLDAHREFSVVGECRNGAEVLASLDTLAPDVVFLDIQMPGIDGFEVIRRRTPERMPVVVFLTAFDEFAIKAFEAHALDYLVKPVSDARFAATIKRVVRQLRAPAAPVRQETIVVSTPRGAVVVAVDEIDWIEAAGNYARIWTGGKGYLHREPLAKLETRVRAEGFLRAHRRALVRVGSVRELRARRTGEVVAVLARGVTVPIARRRRADFASAVRRRSSTRPRLPHGSE
jgi:two-component system LytT family response regulator